MDTLLTGLCDYAKTHKLTQDVCIALMDLVDRIDYVYLNTDGSYGNLARPVSDKVKYIKHLIHNGGNE